jgi:hypothetical protein
LFGNHDINGFHHEIGIVFGNLLQILEMLLGNLIPEMLHTVLAFNINCNMKLLVFRVRGGQLRLDTVVVLDSRLPTVGVHAHLDAVVIVGDGQLEHRLPSDSVHARLVVEGVVTVRGRQLDAAVVVEGCLPAVEVLITVRGC